MAKLVKITGAPSPIAWWNPYIGKVCPVLDRYPPTGNLKIRIAYYEYEDDYPDSPYGDLLLRDGWIDPRYVETYGVGPVPEDRQGIEMYL